MKSALILSTVMIGAALTLQGCAPGQNTVGSTAVGATAGGIIGGLAGGSFGAVAAGALLGGAGGYLIGRSMDRQDQVNMASAAGNTPINEEATWTNDRRHTTYVVRPVRDYRYHGRYCREFRTRVIIGGKSKRAYGRACRQPDGSWQIIK